jgi:hypothetical protein
MALVALVGRPAQAQFDAQRSLQLQQRFQQMQDIGMDQRFLANTAIPPDQRVMIDFGGYFSPQYYSIDNANYDNQGLRQYQLVGYFRANFDGVHDIFLRLNTAYNDYNSGDSFDGFGSRLINPDFDRAYYKFDLQRYEAAYYGKSIKYNVVFEGGRDFIYWGNGLVMAETIDGVMPTFQYGPLTLATIAGITPLRTVDIQPDRPAFSYNTKRGFYGGMLTLNTGTLPINPYFYGILQRDYNTENEAILNGILTTWRYNSFYLGSGASGSLTDHIHYGVEGVFEGGNTLSNSFAVQGFQLVQIPQTQNDIYAWAGDVKADYVPQDEHQSRLSIEGIFATGDPNRGLTNTTYNGIAPNTPDRAFNAFGTLTPGLAFGNPVSNLAVMRCGASTFPFTTSEALRRLQVGLDVYWINKLTASAPIAEFTNSATYLGWEPDFYLNWQALSDVTLTVRYGLFMPNAKAFGTDKARQFLYTGATFAF